VEKYLIEMCSGAGVIICYHNYELINPWSFSIAFSVTSHVILFRASQKVIRIISIDRSNQSNRSKLLVMQIHEKSSIKNVISVLNQPQDLHDSSNRSTDISLGHLLTLISARRFFLF
jgi:hypothetical protein